MDRLQTITQEVYNLINKHCPGSKSYFESHLTGVSNYAAMLAGKREESEELAAIAGMLHDIYQITHGTIRKHAKLGAPIAKEILVSTGLFNEKEVEIIRHAISIHNKKEMIHGSFDEVLKDADVLDHYGGIDFNYRSLYDGDEEAVRYESMMEELST